MLNLDKYIQDKSQLSGVAMMRLIHNGGYWDYTHWELTDKNIFLFDDNMKINHILWLDDTISIVDDNKIIVSAAGNIKQMIAIELFYGGMIL